MNNSKIWLSSPHMGGNEQGFVNEAFATNWVAPLGPNVTGFEQDLENYVGENSNIAALSSGTAALHLGLILLHRQVSHQVVLNPNAAQRYQNLKLLYLNFRLHNFPNLVQNL